MTLTERIHAFAALGDFLKDILQNETSAEKEHDLLKNNWLHTIEHYHLKNAWFTPNNIRQALGEWAYLLTEDNLQKWISAYNIKDEPQTKTVAVIAAGNIPMVCFHDVLTVCISGHRLLLKLSSQDDALLPLVHNFLVAQNPAWAHFFSYTKDKITAYDAVIATGSTNTSRYFEHYFGHVPNIIRKSRHSFAVLDGNESPKELSALAKDVFSYFGLGCRNVSKIWIPESYNFDALFNAFFSHQEVMQHFKYTNNYDYHKAIYLMGQHPLLDNGFILLKEDESWASPIGVLFYEKYSSLDAVTEKLEALKPFTQCIVSNCIVQTLSFGDAQKPKLTDYADGVDTMKFIQELN
jgi:hypothetical protein